MDRERPLLNLIGVPRALIGMLHVGPPAGDPLHRRTGLDLDDQITDHIRVFADIKRPAAGWPNGFRA